MKFEWITDHCALCKCVCSVVFIQQEEGCEFVDISSPLTVSGVFEKLRKLTVSIVMSVRPSFLLSACKNLASTGRIFLKFGI